MDKTYCTVGLMCVLLSLSWIGMAGAAELTDPMRPSDYQITTIDTVNEKDTTDSWKLTAVLLSDKRSVAVVNGRPLQPGDVLEGYTLMDISKDRVVFNGEGKKLVVERTGTGLKKKFVQQK